MSSRAGRNANARDRKPEDHRDPATPAERQEDDEGIEIIEVVGVDETTGSETDPAPPAPLGGDSSPGGDGAPHRGARRDAHHGDPHGPRHDPLHDLEERLQDALRDKEKFYDLLLRKQAEFENYRKRSDREKDESRTLATGEVVKRLLPVLDNLERALRTSEGADGALRQGVLLIHQQILDVLKKLGVQPMETLGSSFDPRLHEAVEALDVAGFEQGVILEETWKGYTLNDRMLRPAMVKVASGRAPRGSNSDSGPKA
jgi:molecular chaperone GrpE